MQNVGRRPQSGLVGSQRASGRWSRDLSGFPHAPFGRVSGSCSAPPQTIPGVRPMSHVSQRRDTWHTLGHCMTRKTQSLRGHMLWHRSCAWRRPLLRGLRHQRSAPSWSSNLNGRCREEIRSELPSSLRSSFAAFPQQGDGCDREVPNSSTRGPRPGVQRLRAARFRLSLVQTPVVPEVHARRRSRLDRGANGGGAAGSPLSRGLQRSAADPGTCSKAQATSLSRHNARRCSCSARDRSGSSLSRWGGRRPDDSAHLVSDADLPSACPLSRHRRRCRCARTMEGCAQGATSSPRGPRQTLSQPPSRLDHQSARQSASPIVGSAQRVAGLHRARNAQHRDGPALPGEDTLLWTILGAPARCRHRHRARVPLSRPRRRSSP